MVQVTGETSEEIRTQRRRASVFFAIWGVLMGGLAYAFIGWAEAMFLAAGGLGLALSMWWTSRPGADSYRSRMAAEREQVRRDLRAQTPVGAARAQPWWKEALAAGPTGQGGVVVAASLLFFAYSYERDGPWTALFTSAIMTGVGLIAVWTRKRRERKAEALYEPLLPLDDAKRDRHDARH